MEARPKKKRLDILLVERGLAESRERARALILSGVVKVEGGGLHKAGSLVRPDCLLEIAEGVPYVSRGGLKLEKALEQFDIDLRDKTVLDVGISTGGFTDCLLKHGASKVIGVDVGYGQVHPKIRSDKRVLLFERTNARYLRPQDLPGPIHGATLDVSFISLTLLAGPISGLLDQDAFIIALIKPQFEVGKGLVGKNGVVRDPRLHEQAISKVKTAFLELGWKQLGLITSPIKGPKGNTEFLLGLKRGGLAKSS